MEKIILKIIVCIAVISGFSSCLKEEELKLPFTTSAPQTLNDGWEISTPANESIDEDKLNEIYRHYHNSKDMWQVRSLLVFRNNKLVAESYTKDRGDIDTPTAIWSCTKQVMAILTGIALEQNILDDINDNIGKYLADGAAKYPNKKDITIKNLLTMQSGIAFENDGLNGESNKLLKEVPENSLNFVLGLPVFAEQGTVFNYNDGDPHLISAIIQSQTGITVNQWAKDIFFNPLGIRNYDWISYKDGITMGAFGILATPREMAKIGQLVLNKGTFNGQEIVSSEWIETMTTTKVDSEKVAYYNTTFGYYWWIDESRDIVFMNGHGGQFVFIKPAKNLMVVTTAEPNTQGKHQFVLLEALKVFDSIDEIAY